MWSHPSKGIAMKPCHNCQAVIDEYTLDKQLEPLRDLTVDDFHLCADCVTVVSDACVECGGAVYVPRNASFTPDYCPACRSDRIQHTGEDPGWTADAVSH
jgi:predicted Zn-ribbon and HTH transcriptional regulator